jgi:gamma-tubulin complex component 5
VIRKSTTSSYQKVSKLLLQIHRAKYLLRQTIFLRSKPNQRPDPLSVGLRQELQFFVDVLHTHLINSVLETSYESMVKRMHRATDLDEMTRVHDGYVSSLLAQYLLTKNLAPILNAVTSVFELVVQFAEMWRRQTGVDTEKKVRKSRRKSRRRALSTRQVSQIKQRILQDQEEESSSDEDENAGEGINDSYDADTEALGEPQVDEILGKMHKDFEHLHRFIVTGLRGIARSGGEATWEMLADQLDWAGVGAARQ